MTDILLVEDQQELNTLMCTFLERAGYQVKGITTGEEALQFWKEDMARLVILDVMLPQMDGFAVCSAIREQSSVPILFLSARVEKEAQMNGFLLGADDYVEKPIDMDILLAKVTALMKRNYDLKQKNMIVHSGAISIDKDKRQAFLDHRELALTGKEYDLLLLLVENPGKTLHKDFLFDSFYRGSNVTDKPGNGLGLYISRQIMNKMDGEMFAERKENGMSFCMVFRL